MSKDEGVVLADRCETAEGPDRELDAEIALAVEGPVYPAWSDKNARRYTASLDAAMTLVPEGAVWRLTIHGSVASAIIIDKGNDELADAATPALALCAAALRARAASQEQQP